MPEYLAIRKLRRTSRSARNVQYGNWERAHNEGFGAAAWTGNWRPANWQAAKASTAEQGKREQGATARVRRVRRKAAMCGG